MRLDHPNVVKLLHYKDFGDPAVKIFRHCCLELCDASLDKAFLPNTDSKKYRGPLPNEIDFMLQLLLGLGYIHKKNLVHRDVKPENILIHSSLPRKGRVLINLSDFLLSKDTKNGEFVLMSSRYDQGTMYYLPSEVLSFYDEMIRLSKETNNDITLTITLTNKIDIFACGIVFFKYLSNGQHPFGTEDEKILVNLRDSQPVNLIKILPTSHFAFGIIQKMLEKTEGDRPNVTEIIPLLTSLKLHSANDRKQSHKSEELLSLNGACQQIKQRKQQLHSLCSHPNPGVQHINKLAQIISEDSIGILNIVDDNGNSPLLTLCQNNQSTNLLPCIEVMISKKHYVKRKSNISTNTTTTELDVNYQDRYGFNALHYVCMKYEGQNLLKIIQLLFGRGIDVNRTERTLGRNALQLLIENNRNDRGDLFEIVQLLLNMKILLAHKDANGLTALHYLCRYHNRRNLIDLVRLLIAKGVDIDAKDCNGKNAFDFVHLFYTLNSNRGDLFRLLFRKENVPAALYSRKTPLSTSNWVGNLYKNYHYHGPLRTCLVVPS